MYVHHGHLKLKKTSFRLSIFGWLGRMSGGWGEWQGDWGATRGIGDDLELRMGRMWDLGGCGIRDWGGIMGCHHDEGCWNRFLSAASIRLCAMGSEQSEPSAEARIWGIFSFFLGCNHDFNPSGNR